MAWIPVRAGSENQNQGFIRTESIGAVLAQEVTDDASGSRRSKYEVKVYSKFGLQFSVVHQDNYQWANKATAWAICQGVRDMVEPPPVA